jgi:hypothetical protein
VDLDEKGLATRHAWGNTWQRPGIRYRPAHVQQRHRTRGNNATPLRMSLAVRA